LAVAEGGGAVAQCVTADTAPVDAGREGEVGEGGEEAFI